MTIFSYSKLTFFTALKEPNCISTFFAETANFVLFINLSRPTARLTFRKRPFNTYYVYT